MTSRQRSASLGVLALCLALGCQASSNTKPKTQELKALRPIEAVPKEAASKAPKDTAKARNPEALLCGHCGQELAGPYLIWRKQNLHRRCYETLAPRCHICSEITEGRAMTLGLGTNYHNLCLAKSARCESCTFPVEGRRGGQVVLDDERIFCRVCYDAAVTRQSQADRVLLRVKQLYREVLGLSLDGIKFEMKLVSQERLQQIAKSDKPGLKGFMDAWRKVFKRGQKTIHGPWTMTVYAAESLPEDDLLGTLSHECFHVWQLLNAPDPLSPVWREGCANYIQWLILKSLNKDIYTHIIENDPDPIYGGGFRRIEKWARGRRIADVLKTMKTRRGFDSW